MEKVLKSIFGEHDKLLGETPTEKKYNFVTVEKREEELSGVERVIRRLLPNEHGEWSDETNTIVEVACMSMFLGAIYGGFTHSRIGYLEFMETNQATKFDNHLDAKRKLQDKVTKSFAKGAFRWSWRLTTFTTTYFTMATAISLYRNKNGILEHVIGGGMAGLTYKFNFGPRGWVVGAALGSTLGLLAGTTITSICALTGVDMGLVRQNNRRIHAIRFSERAKKGLKDAFIEDKTGLNYELERRQQLDSELLNLGPES